MKTIGLIGGMSWESSAVYYKLINTIVREKLGGFHSCKSVMVSVDFAEIEKYQHLEDWNTLNNLMVNSAKKLETAGADLIVLCTNTMHLCAPEIIKNTSVPFLHIAEATGTIIAARKLTKVALLGTRFTMEKDFYKTVLKEKYGIDVIIPSEAKRIEIHRIIYDELVHGEIKEHSKETYKKIISEMERQGAQGVILGCTEIPLLISAEDVNIPVFDTTYIHAEEAVNRALNN